jgi:hypothetical protein
MFHSVLLAEIFHADRVRDLERAATQRRLIQAADDAALDAADAERSEARDLTAGLTVAPTLRSARDHRSPETDGSAGLAA